MKKMAKGKKMKHMMPGGEMMKGKGMKQGMGKGKK